MIHTPARRGQCDAVAFAQRFREALNPKVHLRSPAIDGVYIGDDEAALCYYPLHSPIDAKVGRVAGRVVRNPGGRSALLMRVPRTDFPIH